MLKKKINGPLIRVFTCAQVIQIPWPQLFFFDWLCKQEDASNYSEQTEFFLNPNIDAKHQPYLSWFWSFQRANASQAGCRFWWMENLEIFLPLKEELFHRVITEVDSVIKFFPLANGFSALEFSKKNGKTMVCWSKNKRNNNSSNNSNNKKNKETGNTW